ncbi:carbonic anhydrase [Planctomicrobium piriforme]|uniref:carbonic anhydrase n=1 Tax=Planctomicrobium piriforme TaxID=1576369 RepID=A0A1I3BEL2_9PLAN|nr:carbonic anhydrase [Planctomicrobium piriforme]SFH60580.1 carbonic anhydrase [Planctomicrobium piriforme]
MDLIYRFDPHHPVTLPADTDADSVTQLMQTGNERFVEMLQTLQRTIAGEVTDESIIVPVCPISLGLPVIPGLVPAQAPFAMVVGCADARVPIEIVFDQFFNGMFVVRVAGNALSTEGLGSIQYAVKTMSDSLKLGLVLGHTGCGAMTAAVDSYLQPHDYVEIGFSHALRSVLDRAMIAVRGADRALKMSSSSSMFSEQKRREILIELTIYLNAALTSYQLKHEVRQLGNTDLRICYGVYDLADGLVRPNPSACLAKPCDTGTIFAEPPESPEAFIDLAQGWVQRILSR